MPATELLSAAPAFAPRPPLTRDGIAAFSGILAAHQITVSGPIPQGKTTGKVRYYVIDKQTQAVLGSFVLPDAAQGIKGFRLVVPLGAESAACDVGSLDAAGQFVSANFTIEHGETGETSR